MDNTRRRGPNKIYDDIQGLQLNVRGRICIRCAHLARMGPYVVDAHKYDYLHCEDVFLRWSIEEWADRYEEGCCCELCHRYRIWLELKAISDKEDKQFLEAIEMFLKKGAR